MRAVTILVILSLLSPFSFLPAAEAEAARPVETYGQLLSAIRVTMAESRERVEQAVEREKVREAWEVGKLIDEHVLQHKERANYDEQVLVRLSRDLETSERELYYMLRFARLYPILTAPSKLTWSHYRELVSLEDPVQRKELEEQAVKQDWGHKRIREEISRIKHREKNISDKLDAKPGKVGTYRIVKAADGPYNDYLVIDLGFSNYFYPGNPLKFEAGDIVSLVGATHASPLRHLKDATEADLYTYPVSVREIVDGDTFSALIDLGFGVTTVQTLRLRGLDTREIESAEGREAKEYFENALTGRKVLVRTSKSDKYDRYLVDVFVGERYLNQELVERGLATVVEE